MRSTYVCLCFFSTAETLATVFLMAVDRPKHLDGSMPTGRRWA